MTYTAPKTVNLGARSVVACSDSEGTAKYQLWLGLDGQPDGFGTFKLVEGQEPERLADDHPAALWLMGGLQV